MFTFNHFNFNVLNLEKSMAFYEKALGLKEVRRRETDTYTLVFMGDGVTDFSLELTYLHDRTDKYDLGDEEFHLALRTDDMEAAHALHAEMGCICYENETKGIYFINDPDGYWIEIVPVRK